MSLRNNIFSRPRSRRKNRTSNLINPQEHIELQTASSQSIWLIKNPFYFHLFPAFTWFFIKKNFYWLRKRGEWKQLLRGVLEKREFWSDVFLEIFWNCHNYCSLYITQPLKSKSTWSKEYLLNGKSLIKLQIATSILQVDR